MWRRRIPGFKIFLRQYHFFGWSSSLAEHDANNPKAIETRSRHNVLRNWRLTSNLELQVNDRAWKEDMVRLKNRFLIVQVSSSGDVPDRSDLQRTLRDHLIRTFGLQCAGMASEIQAKFVDESTNLILLRVPRDGCKVIRSSITLLRVCNQKRILCDVLSTSGTIRTAKRRLYQLLQNQYRTALKAALQEATSNQKEVERLCGKLQETLSRVNAIEN